MNNFLQRWQRPVDRGALIMSFILIAIVTLLSLFPAEQLPNVQGNDKLHHFIAYAAVIFTLAIVRKHLALWLSPAIVLYSGLIELLQPFSNRYAEWADFGANSLGVVIGLLIGTIMSPYIMQRLPEKWR
jgi:VanZ family protein